MHCFHRFSLTSGQCGSLTPSIEKTRRKVQLLARAENRRNRVKTDFRPANFSRHFFVCKFSSRNFSYSIFSSHGFSLRIFFVLIFFSSAHIFVYSFSYLRISSGVSRPFNVHLQLFCDGLDENSIEYVCKTF